MRGLSKRDAEVLLNYISRLEEALPDDAKFRSYPKNAVNRLLAIKSGRTDA